MSMPTFTLPPEEITGLLLAGGRGSRMGGVDKGLQPLRSQPLVAHVLQRLAPQVGTVAISANRHLDAYRAWGWPVWPDTLPDHPGPLAGLLAGLQQCRSPWLLAVPCDAPQLPLDLATRLGAAVLAEGSDAAVATCVQDGAQRMQPVFCLLKAGLAAGLADRLAAGERRMGRWLGSLRLSRVAFDEASAFFNANTLDDLRDWAGGGALDSPS